MTKGHAVIMFLGGVSFFLSFVFWVVRDIIEFSEGMEEGGASGCFPETRCYRGGGGLFVYVSSIMKEMCEWTKCPFSDELYMTQRISLCEINLFLIKFHFCLNKLLEKTQINFENALVLYCIE